MNLGMLGEYLLIILTGMLVGGITIGWLIVKKVIGKDLRFEGSFNLGATNSERILEQYATSPKHAKQAKRLGRVILALDALKAWLPLLVAQYALLHPKEPELIVLASGLILGHCYSPYFGFKQTGKGVATTLGVAMFFSWSVGLVSLLFFLLMKWVVKKAGAPEQTAIASTFASLFMFGSVLSTDLSVPVKIFFAIAVLHIIFAHRSNYRRIGLSEKQVD